MLVRTGGDFFHQSQGGFYPTALSFPFLLLFVVLTCSQAQSQEAIWNVLASSFSVIGPLFASASWRSRMSPMMGNFWSDWKQEPECMWISLLFIFLWVTVCSLRGFIHCLSVWLPNFRYSSHWEGRTHLPKDICRSLYFVLTLSSKADFLISDCRLSLILHWYDLHVHIDYLQVVSRACNALSTLGISYLPSLGLHRFHPQPCNSSMFLYHCIPICIWSPLGGLPWPILLDGTHLCCITPIISSTLLLLHNYSWYTSLLQFSVYYMIVGRISLYNECHLEIRILS